MDDKKKRLSVIGIVVLLCIAMAVMLFMALKPTKKKTDNENAKSQTNYELKEQPKVDKEAVKKSGVQTIAFFGVDSRDTNLDSGVRSDSIMVVSINHDLKQVKIASIYRDCMVCIPGFNYEKITHAHSYGGPKLAMDALNRNFDLQIENYLTVNFISMGDLIDQMGGIEQDVDASEVQFINSYIDEVNGVRGTSSNQITEPGNYTMDGTQAVAYSRIRYTEGADYKRTERQRTILFKIFEKAKTLDFNSRREIAETMIKEVNTNMHSQELTEMLYYLQDYSIEDMTAFPKVFYGGEVDGAWVEVPITIIDMARGLHEFLYNEQGYQPSEELQVIDKILNTKASEPNMDMSGASEE